MKLLAEMGRNRVPVSEWLLDRDTLLMEIAGQRRQGQAEGEYWGYLQHRLAIVEAELKRRRELERWGGPKVPSQAPVSKELLEDVKRRSDPIAVLSRYVEVLPGQRWPRHYRCPAHGDGVDRNPSGAIYEEGRYWCFVCNAGGDVFTALQAFGGMSFQQAVETLSSETGVRLSFREQTRGRKGVDL